jgi:hypothetical protein
MREGNHAARQSRATGHFLKPFGSCLRRNAVATD